jgi:protein-L-isoaspartate(D-aspartate) O-methyltransferase
MLAISCPNCTRISFINTAGPWRCTGSSNVELISNLVQSGIITNKRVKEAMLQTDRKFYAPQHPYTDAPQPIGHAATISAPHMHAAACEHLLPVLPTEGAKILDVGCGSGYLTAGEAR